MLNDWDDIAAKIISRRLGQSVLLADMMKVRDRYNGDYVIPLPNTSDARAVPPTMPTIIANAVDNGAIRAGSVSPMFIAPALDEFKPEGVRSRQYASIRRKALEWTWGASQWNLAVRRAYRHLAAYSTTALVVVWDDVAGHPRILCRDPLGAYPEPKAAEDLSPPADIGFVYAKSREWILSRYPAAAKALGDRPASTVSTEANLWDVCEWIDADSCVLGLLGPSIQDRYSQNEPLRYSMELKRWPNLTGRCTAYVPRRVTLDRITSQVANMVDSVDLMAYLTALDIKATEKAIYPDTYIVGKTGSSPQLVGGEWYGGETGKVNIIVDADSVGQLRGTPDPHNAQTVDRLERAANISMGTVPQMQGESYGALRTGRGIDALTGISVDPRIQEMHEIMQVAMTYMNEVIIDTYMGCCPDTQIEGFSFTGSDRGLVRFTPRTHFETKIVPVKYPIPGADVQTTTILLGQLLGAGAISLATMRRLHPYVDDPDSEEHQRLLESLNEANQAAYLNRAAQGGYPPEDQARITQLVIEGKTLSEALAMADAEAKARQAAQPPAPLPGQGAPPETMPGLANPGEGAGSLQQPAAIEPVPGGLANFKNIVQAMRAPNAGVGAR